jgi:hypothetical protein
MAVIVPTIMFANGVDDKDGWICSWAAMKNGDLGMTPPAFEPLFIGFADRSIQVEGTAGAGFSIVWEGSNDTVNFRTLRDPFNNPLIIPAPGTDIYEVLQIVVIARPRVVSGDGTTSVTVTALYKRTKP